MSGIWPTDGHAFQIICVSCNNHAQVLWRHGILYIRGATLRRFNMKFDHSLVAIIIILYYSFSHTYIFICIWHWMYVRAIIRFVYTHFKCRAEPRAIRSRTIPLVNTRIIHAHCRNVTAMLKFIKSRTELTMSPRANNRELPSPPSAICATDRWDTDYTVHTRGK